MDTNQIVDDQTSSSMQNVNSQIKEYVTIHMNCTMSSHK